MCVCGSWYFWVKGNQMTGLVGCYYVLIVRESERANVEVFSTSPMQPGQTMLDKCSDGCEHGLPSSNNERKRERWNKRERKRIATQKRWNEKGKKEKKNKRDMTEVHAAGCHNGGMENNVLYTLGIYVSSPFFVHRVITTSGVCWLACLLALYLHCNKTFRCLYSGDTIITIQRGCTVSYSRSDSVLCYYTIPRILVRI
jgi:hypothetical protein